MPRLLLAAMFCLSIPVFALAQTGSGVNSGLNSDAGSMSAPNINVVNGINANGTPRQQSPGASMTNGAGNSTMTPGVAGGLSPSVGATTTITTGAAKPTINATPGP